MSTMKTEVRAAAVSPPEAGKPTSRQIGSPSNVSLATVLLPVGLILVSAVPLTFGAFRISEWAGSAEITPDNARFLASPLPLVVHLVSAFVYAILGAFQFATGFRRRWPGWHRRVGRLVVACGLVVALSALWMTLFYPRPAGTGDLLKVLRLLFGAAMVVSIVLGFTAIRRGDVRAHRVWMARAYAIGLGPGTQVFTQFVGLLLFGPPDELKVGLQMAVSWAINLAVAEWATRKRPAPRPRGASAVVSPSAA